MIRLNTEEIKRLCRNKDVSSWSLSRRTNLSQSTATRILSGRTSSTNDERARSLARALGVDLDQITFSNSSKTRSRDDLQ